MTNRRQQVQIGNAISDTCSVKFVALFLYINYLQMVVLLLYILLGKIFPMH